MTQQQYSENSSHRLVNNKFESENFIRSITDGVYAVLEQCSEEEKQEIGAGLNAFLSYYEAALTFDGNVPKSVPLDLLLRGLVVSSYLLGAVTKDSHLFNRMRLVAAQMRPEKAHDANRQKGKNVARIIEELAKPWLEKWPDATSGRVANQILPHVNAKLAAAHQNQLVSKPSLKIDRVRKVIQAMKNRTDVTIVRQSSDLYYNSPSFIA